MKSLLLLLCFIPALNADKFVFHIGYHTDTEALAYSVVQRASSNQGININCAAQDANQVMAVGGIAFLLVWIIYKINQIEEKQG